MTQHKEAEWRVYASANQTFDDLSHHLEHCCLNTIQTIMKVFVRNFYLKFQSIIYLLTINLDKSLTKSGSFLYVKPWCVRGKQFAFAQKSECLNELIMLCWEVGTSKRKCHHSDEKKAIHTGCSVPKAVALTTPRVTARFVTRFNLWLRHDLWPHNASICDPARFVTKSASICDQRYTMILESNLCRGKLVFVFTLIMYTKWYNMMIYMYMNYDIILI